MNSKTELNIAENRNHLNYSKWIYVKRILWTFGKFFFRNSPRIAFGYRNTILRIFGAKIGRHVHIYSSTVIWFPWNLEIGDWSAIGEETLIYNLGKVTIGKKATVSHRVHVCAGTHDYTDPALPLLRPKNPLPKQNSCDSAITPGRIFLYCPFRLVATGNTTCAVSSAPFHKAISTAGARLT